MENTENKQGSRFWRFIDNFAGDKVVWMIVILLILISLVTIFSSTSLLANMQKTDRISILKEQSIIALLGLGLIILCYNIKKINIFRVFSKYGFAISLLLLGLLAAHTTIIPMIRPIEINKAWRMLSLFGFQIHVFEVVKVLMVLYLSWAVDAYRYDGFHLAKKLAKWIKFDWLASPLGLRVFYIYVPIIITCTLILMGSVSSALFIGTIFFVTILIGGISIRDVVIPGIAAIILLLGAYGIHEMTDGKVFNRLSTAFSRVSSSNEECEEILCNEKYSPYDTVKVERGIPITWEDIKNNYSQPFSAKLAIRQGGIIGKGPGESTQRYVVPIMYSDYMYSFIIEEYGLVGGLFIIIIFASLLARGALISNWLNDYYAKTAVAGLVVLTVGQAFMHMAINLDLVPRTGQTLPMISHGNSSFLAFSIVFGIILSFSRQARKDREERLRIEKEIQEELA